MRPRWGSVKAQRKEAPAASINICPFLTLVGLRQKLLAQILFITPTTAPHLHLQLTIAHQIGGAIT